MSTSWSPAHPLVSSLPPVHFRSLIALKDAFVVFVEAAHPGDPPLLRCIRVGIEGASSSYAISLATFPAFALPWRHSAAFPPHAYSSRLFLLSSSGRLLLVVDAARGVVTRALPLAPCPLAPLILLPGQGPAQPQAPQTVCLAVSASGVPHYAHVFRYRSGYAVIFCRIEMETGDSEGEARVLVLFPSLFNDCDWSPLLLCNLSSSACRIAVSVAGSVNVYNLERRGAERIERVELEGVAQQGRRPYFHGSHFAWFAVLHDVSCGGAVAMAAVDELAGEFIEKGPYDREQRVVSLPPGVVCRDISLHGGRCLAFLQGDALFIVSMRILMKRPVARLELLAREACIRAAPPRSRVLLERTASHIPFRDTAIRVLGYGE